MAWEGLLGELGDEEEEQEQVKGFLASRDNLIILIDGRENMFQRNAEGKTLFEMALGATSKLLRNRIITSSDDRIAVYIIGSDKSNSKQNFDNLFCVVPLDQPGRDSVEEVSILLSKAQRHSGEGAPAMRYGVLPASSPLNLFNALWASSLAFSGLKATEKRTEDKRIWVFTSDDSPTGGDPAALERVLGKSSDLADNECEISLFAFAAPATDAMRAANPHLIHPLAFDSKDWSQILLRNIRADDIESQQEQLAERIYPQDTSGGVQGLDEDIRTRLHRKRTYARLTFTVAPGMNLALGVYLNIHAAKKPAARTLREGQYDVPLKSNSKYVCKDTGKALAAQDISTVQKLGAQTVPMSREDMKQVKAIAEPGLVLLGFRDASVVKPWNSVRAPAFLFPQEQLIKGSTTAYTALVQQLLAKKKVAIARLVVRSSAEPQLVALVPAPHVVDEDTGRSMEPNGLYAVVLPWADDVRSGMRVAAATAPVSDAAVEAASAAIDALTLPVFHPSQMENPVLQKWFAAAEALAIGEEVAWTPEQDQLQADKDAFAAAAPLLKTFGDAFEMDAASMAPLPSSGTAKRASGTKRSREGGAASGGGGSKKARGDDEDDEAVSREDMLAAYTKGTVGKFKVADLKAYLRSIGLPVSGKKADLVERVESTLGKPPQE